MTIADDGKFCVRCANVGIKSKAHRIMPKGGARCDEHFRDESGLPQLREEANLFIAHCKELEAKKNESLPNKPARSKKKKPVHEPSSEPPEKTAKIGSPTVLGLLDAFRDKV